MSRVTPEIRTVCPRATPSGRDPRCSDVEVHGIRKWTILFQPSDALDGSDASATTWRTPLAWATRPITRILCTSCQAGNNSGEAAFRKSRDPRPCPEGEHSRFPRRWADVRGDDALQPPPGLHGGTLNRARPRPDAARRNPSVGMAGAAARRRPPPDRSSPPRIHWKWKRDSVRPRRVRRIRVSARAGFAGKFLIVPAPLVPQRRRARGSHAQLKSRAGSHAAPQRRGPKSGVPPELRYRDLPSRQRRRTARCRTARRMLEGPAAT